MPDSVTSIGDSAFTGCNWLFSVRMPEKVTSIGNYAFRWCKNLTSVTIPESVTNIGDEAFYGTHPTSVTIPESVTDIGESVFGAIQEVVCYKPCVISCLVKGRVRNLIYLGGGLSEVPSYFKMAAARGFIHAMEQGIKEICRWKAEYLHFIKRKRKRFVVLAWKDRTVLMFMVREGLLDKVSAMCFLKKFEDTDNMEMNAVFIQYYHEHFGTGGLGDLSL